MPTDLYGGKVVKPFLGRIVLKKLAGSGPLAVGTLVVIAHGAAFGRDPENNAYFTGVNGSGSVSGDAPGKYTPSLTISAVLKANFWTANFVASAILATDANGDSDTWAILLDDGFGTEVYDGAKFAGLRVQSNAQGGGKVLTLAALAMYGPGKNDGSIFAATTFASTSVPGGQVLDVTKTTYGGTADLVAGVDVNFVRPQGYVYYEDNTRHPLGIASGIFTGSAMITQSLKYASSWNTSGTLNIGSTGAGVSMAFLVKRDEDVSDMTIANRYKQRTYSLYDSSTGGMPVAVSAM